jgi:hypothetical protein
MTNLPTTPYLTSTCPRCGAAMPAASKTDPNIPLADTSPCRSEPNQLRNDTDDDTGDPLAYAINPEAGVFHSSG